MNTFPIPNEIIDELVRTEFQKDILNPDQVFEIGRLKDKTMDIIKARSSNVFISKRALKHIIDRRGSEKIISLIPEIINNPTKISDNSSKRPLSFIFVKMSGRYHGVVIEITKTPDYENQVVSAFIINPKTYNKMSDISGGAAP